MLLELLIWHPAAAQPIIVLQAPCILEALYHFTSGQVPSEVRLHGQQICQPRLSHLSFFIAKTVLRRTYFHKVALHEAERRPAFCTCIVDYDSRVPDPLLVGGLRCTPFARV